MKKRRYVQNNLFIRTLMFEFKIWLKLHRAIWTDSSLYVLHNIYKNCELSIKMLIILLDDIDNMTWIVSGTHDLAFQVHYKRCTYIHRFQMTLYTPSIILTLSYVVKGQYIGQTFCCLCTLQHIPLKRNVEK